MCRLKSEFQSNSKLGLISTTNLATLALKILWVWPTWEGGRLSRLELLLPLHFLLPSLTDLCWWWRYSWTRKQMNSDLMHNWPFSWQLWLICCAISCFFECSWKCDVPGAPNFNSNHGSSNFRALPPLGEWITSHDLLLHNYLRSVEVFGPFQHWSHPPSDLRGISMFQISSVYTDVSN